MALRPSDGDPGPDAAHEAPDGGAGCFPVAGDGERGVGAEPVLDCAQCGAAALNTRFIRGGRGGVREVSALGSAEVAGGGSDLCGCSATRTGRGLDWWNLRKATTSRPSLTRLTRRICSGTWSIRDQSGRDGSDLANGCHDGRREHRTRSPDPAGYPAQFSPNTSPW